MQNNWAVIFFCRCDIIGRYRLAVNSSVGLCVLTTLMSSICSVYILGACKSPGNNLLPDCSWRACLRPTVHPQCTLVGQWVGSNQAVSKQCARGQDVPSRPARMSRPGFIVGMTSVPWGDSGPFVYVLSGFWLRGLIGSCCSYCMEIVFSAFHRQKSQRAHKGVLFQRGKTWISGA